MTGLQEMFEAESRHTTVTSHVELAAIADATVVGARRRHNSRLAIQSMLGTVGALVIGAGVWAAVAHNETPVAVQPSLSPIEITDHALGSFPEAPALTAEEWASVDQTWDFEWASVKSNNPVAGSSYVGAYVTPPGGERKLVLSAPLPGVGPSDLAAWDPTTAKALIRDQATGRLLVVDLRDQSVRLASDAFAGFPADSSVLLVAPLGVVAGDASYASIKTVLDDGTTATSIVRWAPAAQEAPRRVPATALSSAAAGKVIGYTGDGLMVFDLSSGADGQLVPGSKGCVFHAWNGGTTYIARCYSTDTVDSSVQTIRWERGDTSHSEPMTVLSTEVHDSTFVAPDWAPYGPHLGAPDGEITIDDDNGGHVIGVLEPKRELQNMSALPNGLWQVGVGPEGGIPVIVDPVAWSVRDLGKGFTHVPDTYNVILGATE